MKSFVVQAADYFVYITATAAVVDALILTFVATRCTSHQDERQTITPGRLFFGIAVAGMIFVTKCMAVVLISGGGFSLIHLTYDALVITLPLSGLLILFMSRVWRDRLRLSKSVAAVAILSLLAIPIGVYTTFIEPFRVQLETADVILDSKRAGIAPITVGVLADIQTEHVTDHERDAIDRLMACEPDLILIPGDIFQGRDAALDREIDAVRNLLGRLHAPAGVFVVEGHCENASRLRRLIDGLSIRFLDNKAVTVTFKSRRLTITGVGVHQSPELLKTIRRLETEPGEQDIRILFSHSPDSLLLMQPESRIDLFVAGHTHGGQVVIPFFGPPITFSLVPRHIGAGGLHTLNGRRIYVSRGLGWEHWLAPRIRFLCPPEVTLLTLK